MTDLVDYSKAQFRSRTGIALFMMLVTTIENWYETSETSIAITFLVVNLSRLLRQFFGLFLSFLIFWRTNELMMSPTL
jgi:hypothetical protein